MAKQRMVLHKTWLFLLFFCTATQQASPPKKHSPSALSRVLTSIFGLPAQDLKLKNFVKNSLPNLISLCLRPAVLKIHATQATQRDNGTLKKWGLKTEAAIALVTLFLRLMALSYTHIYKKSPAKPFNKTAIESVRNTIFALFHAALTSTATKETLTEMETATHPWHKVARRTHAVALLALESFYLARRLKSARQRYVFLKRMRNSNAHANSFVAGRNVPKSMVGKKYLTLQTPHGYLLKNGEEIIARMHTIAELVHHAIRGPLTQKTTNATAWKTAQNYKQRAVDFLTKPRIPHMQITKLLGQAQENTDTSHTKISLATLLCDIPYISHIFILKEDALTLSRADQLQLYAFIREDHLHAVTRIHTYLQPLTKPF